MIHKLTATLLALAVLPLATGCGEGAAESPKVTLKPSTPDGGGDAANGASNGAAKAGGETVAASGFGTFKGRVLLTGSASPLPPLVEQGANIKDGEVCAAQPVPNQKLVVGPGNGVANVFIYMVRAPKGGKDQASHEPTETPVFDQKGCVFIPHALVVRAGKPITVTSSDSVPHNVHTFPKKNNTFNDIVAQGAQKQFTYNSAELEPVEVKCDFHTWMRAYQLPLEHPYGVLTAEDGSFEIKDLPVGEHEFRIWHEGKLLDRGYKVAVSQDGEVVEKEIQFPAALLQARREGPPNKVIMLSSLR